MNFKKTVAFAAALCMLCAAAPMASFEKPMQSITLCAGAAELDADMYSFLKENTSDTASAVLVGDGTTVTMSGRTYGSGIRFSSQWNRESSIDLNVEKLNKLTFTAGHVDGEGGGYLTMSIYLDDELYKSEELSGTSELKEFDLPVENIKLARIVFGKADSSTGVYAIAGIRTDSLNTEDAYSVPAYAVSKDITASAYNLVKCTRYPDAAAEDAKPVVMNGRTFESGISANVGWNTGASFGVNVDNVNKLFVTVGHIDDTGNGHSDSELRIYLDGNLFDTIELTERMELKTIEIPAKKFSTAVFVINSTGDSDSSYGFADFRTDQTAGTPADTTPVYKTGKDIADALFDCKRTTAYPIDKGKYEEAVNLNMCGRTFASGIVLNSGWNTDSSFGINTEDADELSFTIGHLDGGGNSSATLKVYLDGKQYKLFKDADGNSTGEIQMTYAMPLKTITLPVKGVQSVRLVLSSTNDSKGDYGVADFRTQSAADEVPFTDPDYKTGKDFVAKAFNKIKVQDYPIESENLFEDATPLQMNGRSYENAMTISCGWSTTGSVGIDTSKIDKLSFTVGHQDLSNYQSTKLDILLDGKKADISPIELTPEMPLKRVELDVKDVQSIHLVLNKSENDAVYGIADFVAEAGGKVVASDKQAYTLPEYTDSRSIINSAFSIHNTSKLVVTTDEYEEPQTFAVSGVDKTDAVIMKPTWSADSMFGINTDGVDQLTCKIGALDSEVKDTSTLNIYLDGVLYEAYKDLPLTKDMKLTDLTIPTKGVQFVCFKASKVNNGSAFAVTDFGFTEAAKQPATETTAPTETTTAPATTTTLPATTTTQATTITLPATTTTQATTTTLPATTTTQATTTTTLPATTTTQATTTTALPATTTTQATTTTTLPATTTTQATTTTSAPAETSVTPYSKGDVDGDGIINAKDAARVLIAAAYIGTGNKTGLTAEAESAADVNKDGTINSKYASVILQYAAAVGTGKKLAISDLVSEVIETTTPVIVGERVTQVQTQTTSISSYSTLIKKS